MNIFPWQKSHLNVQFLCCFSPSSSEIDSRIVRAQASSPETTSSCSQNSVERSNSERLNLNSGRSFHFASPPNNPMQYYVVPSQNAPAIMPQPWYMPIVFGDGKFQ